jgi:hypothetical protein
MERKLYGNREREYRTGALNEPIGAGRTGKQYWPV